MQEMLSYFPARDVEEQVSKEFLRAELAEMASGLRSEFRAEIRAEIGALRTELREEISGVRGEIGGLRTELREEIRRMVWMNLGGFVAFGAVIIAAVWI